MPKARIEILFDPATGQIAVNAPTDQLMLCYAMLELAKDVCRQQANVQTKTEPASGIIPAAGVVIPNIKG